MTVPQSELDPIRWTFLPYREADVRTQMAIDFELANLCERANHSAYLRLYRMDPPGITIGRNQKWRTVIDPDRCANRGWDWMRRPTGGGALLHQGELNYCVVAPRRALDDETAVSFRPAFGKILNALAQVIRNFGLVPTVCLGRGGEAAAASPGAHGLCAQSLTRFEIMIDGRKAVAAAHRNFSHSILQHGTLYRDTPAADDQFWPNPQPHSPAIWPMNWYPFGSVLKDTPGDAGDLTAAFKHGFESSLGIAFATSEHLPISQKDITRRLELWMNEDWRTCR